MRSIKSAILTISAILVFTGCQKGPQSQSQSKTDEATFLITPVSGENVQIASTDPTYNLPTSKSVRIKACIQDLRLVQPVIGQGFIIEGGASPIQEKTDADGCLYWNDSVKFSYLGKEQYIQIERKIEAARPYRGMVVLELAIDPWKSSSDALVDLRYGSTQALGSEEDSSISQSKLIIQEMQARFYNQQFSNTGLTVSGQFSFKPVLARIGYDGLEVQEPLAQGQFQIELVLIEKPRVGNQGAPEILDTESVDVQAASAFVETQVDFHLSHVPSQYSMIEVGFKVSPKNLHTLAPEEGLLEMDQLIGQGTYPKEAVQGGFDAYIQKFQQKEEVPQKTSDNTSIPDHANAVADTSPSPSTGSVIIQPSATPSLTSTGAFQFDSVHVDFGAVEKTSKNENVPTQVGIQISACIKSSVDLKPIFNFPFDVAVCSSPEQCTADFQPATSDLQGCLHWQDHISFDYFSSEKWMPRYLVVHSSAAPFKDQENQFTVYVDPWQTGSLFQWDSRNGEPPKSPPLTSGASAAHLDISGFTFNYVGRSFQVDSNMNLIVHRKYQFQINPSVRRMGNMTQGLAYDSIKAGRYRLRALLMSSQDSTAKAAEPISMYSGLVDAVDGVIVANVEFPYSLAEMPLIASRGQIILELSDLSQNSTLKAGTVSAPFQALDASGTFGVTTSGATVDQLLSAVPAGSSISQFSARGTSLYFRRQRIGSVENLFKSVTGMSKLSDPTLASIAEAQSDLNSTSLSGLCAAILPETVGQMACRVNPQKYLQAFRFLQVAAVTGAPVELSGDSYTLNVSAFIGYSENQGETTSKQINFMTSVNAGLGGSLGLSALGTGASASLGWKTEAGWNILHSWDRSKVNTQQVSVVEMKSLNTEALTFQIPAKVHRCFAVKAVNTNNSGAAAGFYFCSPTLQDQSISESWYYISQTRTNSTALQDSGNLTDNGWMKIIRGREQFSEFRKTIEDSSKALVFEHDEAFLNAAKTFGKSFGGLSGVVPMLDDSNIPGVVFIF